MRVSISKIRSPPIAALQTCEDRIVPHPTLAGCVAPSEPSRSPCEARLPRNGSQKALRPRWQRRAARTRFDSGLRHSRNAHASRCRVSWFSPQTTNLATEKKKKKFERSRRREIYGLCALHYLLHRRRPECDYWRVEGRSAQ